MEDNQDSIIRNPPSLQCIEIHSNLQLKIQQNQSQDAVAGKIWEASHLLIQHITNNLSNFESSYILELGTGTGIVGIAVALLLSQKEKEAEIVLTDITEAIPLIRENIQINSNQIQSSVSLHAEILDWFHPEDFQLPSNIKNIKVLISDCVYWKHLHAPLLQTLKYLLNERPEMEIWMSYKQRSMEKELDFFLELEKEFDLKIIYDQDFCFIFHCKMRTEPLTISFWDRRLFQLEPY